uniref:Portal protein n=1 Tax=viral metagenome TaxID=1070528 RepID=A0A6H1ZEI1_9ZZZZ
MPEQTISLGDKLSPIACKQIRTSADFKKTRLIAIKKNEEFYNGRKISAPIGVSTIALPTMAGFVEDLKSKIDDPPVLKYTQTDLADLKIMQKASAAWQKDSATIRGNWPLIDRWAKTMAIFSGRAIYQYMAESIPKYRSVLSVVDYEDFLCEPMGGGHLENHLFCGKDNVFRTKSELKKGAEGGIYNAKQVSKLISSVDNKELKINEDYYSNKNDRFKNLGLDIESHQYVGQDIYRLVEWCMTYNGERYYMLLEYNTGVWIRCQPLKEVFRNARYPYVSWATNEDALNFWSKAPCDDVRPVAHAIDSLFNQAVDNRNKKNFGMRGYSAEMIPHPKDLEWRPDGLVRFTPKGRPMSEGIYEFNVGDISGTIDLVALMKGYIDREVGTNPQEGGAEGQEQKVGIYFGNLQRMADKIGLKNKSYRECWQQLGLRYFDGLVEHLNEPMMVQMIGETGVEWDELRKDELKEVDDFNIEVESGSAEVAANEMKMQKRRDAITLLVQDQELKQSVGQQWLIQEILRFGSYEEADIKVAMAKEGTNIELLSEASKAIQEILAGKKPKLNRGADTSFIKKILDFATDSDVDLDKFKALTDYAKAHIPVAMENMARKANAIISKIPQEERPMLPTGGPAIPEPNPAIPQMGTSGIKATNILQGKSQPAPI